MKERIIDFRSMLGVLRLMHIFLTCVVSTFFVIILLLHFLVEPFQTIRLVLCAFVLAMMQAVNVLIYRYYQNAYYFLSKSETDLFFEHKKKNTRIKEADILNVKDRLNLYIITLKNGKKIRVLKAASLTNMSAISIPCLDMLCDKMQ